MKITDAESKRKVKEMLAAEEAMKVCQGGRVPPDILVHMALYSTVMAHDRTDDTMGRGGDEGVGRCCLTAFALMSWQQRRAAYGRAGTHLQYCMSH